MSSILPDGSDSKSDAPAITPNDGEYERAAALIDWINDMGPAMAYRTVAHVLATQRAAYEAVANDLDAQAASLHPMGEQSTAYVYAAQRIRQVA